MLDNLRRFGRTLVGKILGVFLLIGLAGFGISNVLLDFGSQTVARVGDEDITTQEFARAYNEDLQFWAQRLGQMPTTEMAMALGIPAETLTRLANASALDQLTARMGIGVSDDRLSRLVREDPRFADILGQFDREGFRQALQRLGYTEAEYLDLQSKDARRDQLQEGLLPGTSSSAAAKELLARYTGDTRTIDYFIVNATSIPPVVEPTDDELTAYLTEHQDQFRTEETRTADILVLSIQTLAATREITDEEVAAEYERTKDGRVRIERRTILQAPLNAAQQGWFERGKAAGKTFDELIAETGVAVTSLDNVTKAEVLDAALGNAAFALAEGEFVLIPGIGGQRAVTVTDIEPGGQITLEEAREEIRTDLAEDEARAIYTDILDQVEDQRAGLQSLAEIAEGVGLPLHQVTLRASGAELEAVASIAEENRQRVASGIFAAAEDRLAPTIPIGATNNVWFELKGIEPARDQTLDEVRDAVTAALIEERTAAAITAEVESVLARLEAGEAFADIALSLNLFPVLSPPIKRSGDGTILDQSVAAAAFAGGEGHFGSALNGDGDQVVFQVVEIVPGTETTADMDTFLDQSTRLTLYSDFITAVRNDAGMRVNQQALNQLLALDATGQ